MSPSCRWASGRLCIFNRWTAGIGQFNDSVRLIGPDQTTVISQSSLKFELRDPTHAATGVMLFANLKIETAGTYYIEVLVDDVMKLRYPLPVIVTPPPNQPGTLSGASRGGLKLSTANIPRLPCCPKSVTL